jgi:hypothetical protein
VTVEDSPYSRHEAATPPPPPDARCARPDAPPQGVVSEIDLVRLASGT